MRRFSVMLLALFLVSGLIAIPAYAANEKGPRCSDGEDNDNDGLVDGDDPDCGVSEKYARRYMVLDRDKNEIGEALQLDDEDAAVIADVDGPAGPVRIFFYLGRNGVSASGVVLFTTSNCSGVPYLYPNSSETFPGLTLTAFEAVIEYAPDPTTGVQTGPTGVRQFYLPDGPLVSVDIQSYSLAANSEGGFFCNPAAAETLDMLPATLIGDFNAVFPPPYDVVPR